MNEDFLSKKLAERKEQQALRQLKTAQPGMVDFCSNDYLGIVRNRLLPSTDLSLSYGATGSRLLTGNYSLIEETEELIAGFHASPAALIFNSGYDANVGLLSCVPQRGDTILYDYLSHASIRDGIRLSMATAHSFAHNSLDELENKLKHAAGTIFVVTESVFSMDGDSCPLEDMLLLCERYGARLIVDEAHATGVIGQKGEGLVQQSGWQERVFARVHTFGKACGVHGAAVTGSELLRQYLVNFARSFIYSTALPAQAIAHIQAAYRLFPGMTAERAQLQELIRLVQRTSSPQLLKGSDTPIQGWLVPGNQNTRDTAAYLQSNGLDVRPILYPTVPKGGERLRIVLHAFNTPAEVELLLNCLEN